MPIEDFVTKRKETVKGILSLTEKRALVEALNSTSFFVDCNSCEHKSFEMCRRLEDESKIPLEVIPLGCGSGIPDVPI